MDGPYQDPATIQSVLRSAKTVAIVGLSKDPESASNGVGAYLKDHGYRIVPVHPKEKEILGEPVYATLADIPFPVDVVDVFRKPEVIPQLAKEAVAIGAKALWLQIGISNDDAAQIAGAGGLAVIMDRCMRDEHSQLPTG